eukprot:GFUD01056474.1.p1 GENE.GFUD01056474.1~~GFUD01056474.1.p1  ORF type:complete len:169 (+),score=42.13 GFUD01056474.1:53-508(+)
MVKNQTLLKFRKEDMACEHQRKRQNLHKRVTWSKNLFEIRTVNSRQSQIPSTAEVSCPEENCDETEHQTYTPQPQGQTCRKQSQEQTFSLRNLSEESSSESAEEFHKWIFGCSKLELEYLRFSFLENCEDQEPRYETWEDASQLPGLIILL